MQYYFYENWVANGRQAHIHRADCGNCNYGKGVHGTVNERNGRWHGPFKTYKESYQAALRTGGKVYNCQHCSPQMDD
jgi:hypothetical protein